MESGISVQTSLLPPARVTEIRNRIDKDYRQWETDSCSLFWEAHPTSGGLGPKRGEKIKPAEPLWATFATANPVIANGKKYPGIRACIAFHKIPCSFKRQTKGRGCSHCALSMVDRDIAFIEPSDQIAAVAAAIEGIAAQLGTTPPILEILPDGSFLNTEEVPLATQEGIFHIAAEAKEIVQISIESRVEHISVERIIHLLRMLRDEQVLEIYVGLETIDPFVLNHIVKKGFTVGQFEEKVDEIAGQLPDQLKKRILISVYHFFNPPYLTEKESIESAIAMGRKVREYARRTKIAFSIKYEPAVISKGTFQWYLFERKKYTPPSYFSVAEIIAIAYFEGFSEHIKFGQRDDIDDFQTVASIPSMENPQMLSIFDFMVYNAVQRFNADQDIWMFCADMSIALGNAPEFQAWEMAIHGEPGKSALSRVFTEYKQKGFGDRYEGRMAFQKKVGNILESVEYDNTELSQRLREEGKKGALAIPETLHALFSGAGIQVLQTKKMMFFDTGKINNAPVLSDTHPDFAGATEEAVYQAEVIIENEVGLPQSVWVKAPLRQVKHPPAHF